MGFLSRLFSRFSEGKSGQKGYTTKDGPHGIHVYVQCDKCGEKIPVRLSTTAELQRREGPEAELGAGAFFVRKTIVGNRCYQRIEATIDFDNRYNVVDSEVQHGRLLTVQEYESEDES